MSLIPLIPIESTVQSVPDYRLGFNNTDNSQWHLVDQESVTSVTVPHESGKNTIAEFYSDMNIIVSPNQFTGLIPTVGSPSNGVFRPNPTNLYITNDVSTIYIYSANDGNIWINFYSSN